MELIPHSGASAIGDAGAQALTLPKRFDFSARLIPIRMRRRPLPVLETHMSYVFLAGDKVLQAQKPCLFPGSRKIIWDILTRRDFALDHGRTPILLDLLESQDSAASRSQLQERVLQGRVVDGHGDLRPEHICFRDPTAIFDCLEFNAELRQVDPFDELAYLGVECALDWREDARRRNRQKSRVAALL